MIRHRLGRVSEVLSRRGPASELRVRVGGGECCALNYHRLTGAVEAGDLVLLNTTALFLELGSGGCHFVQYNLSRPPPPFYGPGHIMKLCYTPWQMRVLSCEESEAGFRRELDRFKGLQGGPVLIGELHSMLAPAVAVIKYYRPSCRVAYIMTDGTALPLAFSRTVYELKEKGLLCGTVTCGHAFGGDLEAVNVYSALAACRELIGAEIVIIGPGPGSIGTGRGLGFSGMETGEHVNRVAALGGAPIYIPRISFAEKRRRHFGVSHHTLTALRLAAHFPARLALPEMARLRFCLGQMARAGLLLRHRLHLLPAPPLEQIMERMGLGELSSMGRSYRDDPVFFDCAAAAAAAALEIVGQKKGGVGDERGRERTSGKTVVHRVPLPRENSELAPRSGAYPGRRQGRFAGGGGAPRGCGDPGARPGETAGSGAAIPPGRGADPLGNTRGEARRGRRAAAMRPKRARRGDRLPGGEMA